MTKTKNESELVRQEEANLHFREHVQSVAFNLSLSLRMISLLQAVRDYGFPGSGDQLDQVTSQVTRMSNGAHQYIKFSRALQDRGLIIHSWPKKRDEPSLVLSEAGKLVCELLVLSGLMPPANKKRL